MQQKKKKKEFNDLLLPIIITIAVLPFITRLVMYSCHFSEYPWFSDYDIVSDFFSYYRSYIFLILSIIASIILILYLVLYRKVIKDMRAFIPLAVYSAFTILSTLFSVNKQISLSGGYAHFETVFTLLGYVIISIYTYQFIQSESDIKSVMKAVIISVVLMCIIGFFQIIGKDLITFEWFQKLIIPSKYWNQYLGSIKSHIRTNAVSLTLFNPNYASVYISMLIPLFLVIFPAKSKTLMKVTYLTLLFMMLIILFRTYSRTGILSLFFCLVLFAYFLRYQIKLLWKQLIIVFLGALCLFVLIDSQNSFTFTTKIVATFKSINSTGHKNSLEEIKTLSDKVYIRYNGGEMYTALKKSQTSKYELAFYNQNGEEVSNLYNAQDTNLELDPFRSIKFSIETVDNQQYLKAEINRKTWRFYVDSKEGYLYLNDFGKADKLTDIKKVGSSNHENFASSRGFIWSRTIPLLKDTLFIGSGPDTFPIVFPQSDYVGKANNCKTPYTLIEKPHNLYLMIGVQTGIISLIAFLCFYIFYITKSLPLYSKLFKDKSFNEISYIEKTGLGCMLATISYMISGFFNDSSLQTSPVFWVLIGMGLMINYKIAGQEKGVNYAGKKR